MVAIKNVTVTGGAGYVGAALVPRLLKRGYNVQVLDLFLYGEEVMDAVKEESGLRLIKGDIRDTELIERVLPGTDAVIHLACISNDPSFDLDPTLGRSVNYGAFEPLVLISKRAGVRRFIYASSSSVYGVSEDLDVTEEHALRPLTDYSKYKAMCEPILLREQSPEFTTVVVRPATVCGYSPRQRFDVIVNILTNHAVNNHVIKVFGGDQLRPNIHIEDMTTLYTTLLQIPEDLIAGKVFNTGYENRTVSDIAEMVRRVVSAEMPAIDRIDVVTTNSPDNRSYHISSEKIYQQLGFLPRNTIEDAVRDLVSAFETGRLPNSMTDPRYFNIKTMQELNLK